MSNPALELAELFEAWQIPRGSTAEASRKAAKPVGMTFWRQHSLAVEYLIQIEAELRAMQAAGDDVEDYVDYLRSWYEGVFAYRTGFRPGIPDGALAVPVDSYKMLKGLGLLLGKIGMRSVGSPTQRQSLLACIESAVGLIEDELVDWDRSEKEYLFRVLEAARALLKENAVLGEADLRSMINELIGALTGIALDLRASEGPESTRFQTVMNWIGRTTTVLRGIVYDSEAVASLTTSVSSIAKAITSGE